MSQKLISIFLDPSKVAARRPMLEQMAEKLQEGASKRRSKQCISNWTADELAKVQPYGDWVKDGTLSYHKACTDLMDVLPGRTFEAIRKKLKNWVNNGRFL